MFMENGFGLKRYELMYNDFIVVGPKEDKNKCINIKTKLKDIITNKFLFISRGDDSGTHKKELELWNIANLNPKNLSESEDYDNLFFSKIDEVDDLIVEGKTFEFIINRFDLNEYKSFTVDENGTDKDLKKIGDNDKQLIKKFLKQAIMKEC